MKNIIKTSFCLIVIVGILLSSLPANAAQTDVTVLYSATANANTIYSEAGSTEYNSQSNVTMQYSTNIRARINLQDGYFTGYYRFQIGYTPAALGNGWTLQAANVSANITSDANDEYRTTIYLYPNSSTVNVEVFFYNFPCFNDYIVIDLGVFTWIYSWYTTNSNTWASIPASAPLTAAYTFVASYKNFSAIPNTTQNYTFIWKQIIIDALAAGDLDDVYDLLNQWKTAQDGWLADITLDVDDIEDILNSMDAYLNSIDNTITSVDSNLDDVNTKLQNIYNYFDYLIYDLLPNHQSTVRTRLNTIIARLDTIINQNASDTAAESQMQDAGQQLSQAVNNMDVTKPNINNVVNAGDSLMDQNITGAQSDTFFWLHGTNIFVTILTMAITVGILGFVIYGKSG